MKLAEKRKRQHWKLSIDQIQALEDIRIPDNPSIQMLTYNQLANKIGISVVQLTNPMKGRTDCSYETHQLICKFIERQKRKVKL